MLIDRPVNSTKVLQGQFAKKDPSAANDPDFMKAEGGVVEMKDKAVNMYEIHKVLNHLLNIWYSPQKET